MGTFVNLFSVIAAGGRGVKISKRGRDILIGLDRQRQLDHDRLGRPVVLKVKQIHGLDEIYVLRDGKVAAITVNPRGTAEPQLTWNLNDGWQRAEANPLKPQRNTIGARRERLRRDAVRSNPYLDAILGGSHV